MSASATDGRARLAEVALDVGVAAAVTACLALWDSRFHVVPTATGWWRGVSDPPSAARFGLAAALGIGIALGLHRRPAALRAPLLLLGLAAAPVIPVATGAAVVLLAFQGPVLVLVAGAAVALTLVHAVRGDPGRTSAVLLFAAPFAFYVALATRIPGAAGPQGDEPHYLVMAQSLTSDLDLDLTDEYGRAEYTAFFPGRLSPHVSPSSPPDHLRSVHSPGLSLLIVPAYALGGLFGVQVFLSALAALAGVLVHRLVLASLGDRTAAAIAWAVFSFTPPVPVYAVSVYPELPAAAATAVLLLTARGRPEWRGALGAAAVAAALPWLHSKFLPLGALGLALTLIRPCPWRVRAAALAVYAAGIAALLALFHHLYGRASFSAAFGSPDIVLGRLPWGAAAMLLDRQFGLVPFSPVWLLAVPGVVVLMRRRTGDAIRALLMAAVPLVVGGAFVVWWGGSCPPARFMVPALPALALMAAPAARARKDAAAALGGFGYALLGLAADAPRILHNRLDGESLLLRNLDPSLDLNSFLPSFFEHSTATPLLALTLLAGAALAWRWGARGAAIGLVGLVAVAGAVRTRPLVDPQLAVEDVLDAWEPDNWIGPAGPPALRALSLPLELQKGPWTFAAGQQRNSRRTTLFPGDYQVEVRARPREGQRMAIDVVLTAGELGLARARLTGDQPHVVWSLLLPAGGRQLGINATGVEGQGTLEEVRIAPQALVPRHHRGAFPWPIFAREDRYRIGAGLIRATALDDSEPDGGGFRLTGEEGTFLVDGPPGAMAAVYVRREGPRVGDAVEWAGRTVALPVSTMTRIDFPLAEGQDLGRASVVPLRVRAAAATWLRVGDAYAAVY